MFLWEGVVLSIFTPAGTDVKALVQLGQHPGNVARVILQVAIHGDHDFPRGEVEPSHHRGGLAVVAAKVNDFDAGVFACEAIEDFLTAIVASVVHKDQFPRLADLGQDAGDAFREDRQ